MSYDGIFFDSGSTIFDYSPHRDAPDPPHTEIAAGGPGRAAAALRWLGHEVEDSEVANHLAELKSVGKQMGPAYTEEDLVSALFERLQLEPRRDEVIYVTGVFSGPRFRAWLFPEVANTLQKLADTGIFIGLIANTSVPGWVMDRHFHGVDLLRFLSVRIYSGDEGVEKPDPAIFRLAEERSGLVGKRLIYMGDRVDKDMAGAEAAGWSSILFRSVTDSSEGRAAYEIDSWIELPSLLG